MSQGRRPTRITHVITDLDVGGAETVLLRLLQHTPEGATQPTVVSLAPAGPLAAAIEATGAHVVSLGMRPGRLRPRQVNALLRALRGADPQVIQTWMYHGDLLGGLAARRLGIPVVWGVHQTDLSPDGIRGSTRAIARLNAALADRIPRAIVCCSTSARTAHVAQGYPVDRTVVIPNGFDVGVLDPSARARVRANLGVAPEAFVVGRIGRVEPQKDHRTFLRAARLIADAVPSSVFLLAGRGASPSSELARAVADLDLTARTLLLDERRDVADLHAAMDVAVSSSSFGEAMPLVIGEALERAVPVVVTDVGDSARMAVGAGDVVPPASPVQLAEAVIGLWDAGAEERARLGAVGRRRIEQEYSVHAMVHAYLELHRTAAGEPR